MLASLELGSSHFPEPKDERVPELPIHQTLSASTTVSYVWQLLWTPDSASPLNSQTLNPVLKPSPRHVRE